jgi:hypothetical protein
VLKKEISKVQIVKQDKQAAHQQEGLLLRLLSNLLEIK